jgi:hypothetical protein
MNIFPSRSKDKYRPMRARGQTRDASAARAWIVEAGRSLRADNRIAPCIEGRFPRGTATIAVLSDAYEVQAWISVSPKSS